MAGGETCVRLIDGLLSGKGKDEGKGQRKGCYDSVKPYTYKECGLPTASSTLRMN